MESDVAAKELGKLIVDVSDLIKKLAALKDISTEDFAGLLRDRSAGPSAAAEDASRKRKWDGPPEPHPRPGPTSYARVLAARTVDPCQHQVPFHEPYLVSEGWAKLPEKGEDNQLTPALMERIAQTLRDEMGYKVEVEKANGSITAINIEAEGEATGGRLIVTDHNDYLNGYSPDLTFVPPGHSPAPVSAICVFEVLLGNIREPTHRGKIVYYLEQLLQALPERMVAYGALLTSKQFQAFQVTRPAVASTNFEYHDFVALELSHPEAVSAFMTLLKANHGILGFCQPKLRLKNPERYTLKGFLNMGHSSLVYEYEGDDQKRYAVKIMQPGTSAKDYKAEKAVLSDITRLNLHGLPHLKESSGGCGAGACLVTFPVVRELKPGELTHEVMKELLDILAQLPEQAGVVHGDVEPRHLCITRDGKLVQIIDLSSARNVKPSKDAPAENWQYRGTLAYSDDAILNKLADAEARHAEHVQIQRAAAHDYVALIKCFLAMKNEWMLDVLSDLAKQTEDNATPAQDVQAWWADFEAKGKAGIFPNKLVLSAFKAAHNGTLNDIKEAVGFLATPPR